MRLLRFSGSEEARNHYRVIDEAVRTGPSVQGIDDLRTVGRILDKLEAIGTETKLKRPMPEGEERAVFVWVLNEGGGELKLEEAEFLWVRRAIDEMSWLPVGARRVAAAFDFVGDAEPVP